MWIVLEASLVSVNPGLMVWTAVTFVLLLFALYKLAWKPILSAVENREQRIRESLEKAEEAQRKAEESLQAYQKMLEDAKKETQEIINRGRKTAESLREEILAKANEEASRMLEKAKREINLEREKALEEIRNLAVELSLTAASKLVEHELTKEEHKKLIEQYLKEIRVS